MTTRPPYLSIALISATALAYEILLMRLFSIIQWHHFAYMMIALALLGYGLSGTLITIFQSRLQTRFTEIYIGAILLFAISAVTNFLIAQSLDFNTEAIFWNLQQLGTLSTIFLLLMIPFFFAAAAICLTFMNYGQRISSIYAVDLLGAGVGSLGIIGLLYFVFPQSALMIIGLTGFFAALSACLELKASRIVWLGSSSMVAIAIAISIVWEIELNITPYKGLPQTLQIANTNVITQQSSPLGLISVVKSHEVPFRHAPGLSLIADDEPPEQLAVFTDADNMTVITRYPQQSGDLAYLDQMTSALAYHLSQPERVLIIGAGGGADLLQAQYHTVSAITAIELNAQLISLMKHEFRDFSGDLYQQPGIEIVEGDARGYLIGQDTQFDLIQLSMVDAFNASGSGLYALNESYLYTTEAIQLYLQHLRPEGYLSISRWIKVPPRDTLKLFATAVTALKRSGIKQPEQHLILIRNWQTSTLLVKPRPITQAEHKVIQRFCQERLFDLAYSPHMTRTEANKNNQLVQPYFYSGAMALLSQDADRFMDGYKFYIQPATDNRPYFHHFFKWSTLTEILELRGKGGMPLLEWGYIVLLATLMISMILSLILVVLPVFVHRRKSINSVVTIKRRHVISYFFSIGLAFLFIEIAFMQKFILFLHHPIYSIATVLTAFLVFAGLGSNWGSIILNKHSQHKITRWAVTGIVIFSIAYLLLLEPIFQLIVALPLSFKTVIAIILIAPLAFCMGIPFPMALATLAQNARHLVPWAWGINGCASVVSVALATLLAMHFGFQMVIVIAITLYLSALASFPKVCET